MCCQITFRFLKMVSIYTASSNITRGLLKPISQRALCPQPCSPLIWSVGYCSKYSSRISYCLHLLQSSPGDLSPLCQFRYKFLNPNPHHLTSILIVLQAICEGSFSLGFLKWPFSVTSKSSLWPFCTSELLLCQHFSISFNFKNRFFYKAVNAEPPIMIISLVLTVFNSWWVANKCLSVLPMRNPKERQRDVQ